MRRPRSQILKPGSACHKIWRCHNREFLLQDHREKHAYLQVLHDDYIQRCSSESFAIYAYCVMGNHAHEADEIRSDIRVFSEHMRRANGRFGLCYNKRHGRLGKVAHDRPKTLFVQDQEHIKRLMFYLDANPVRAGLVKHPTDLRWKDFSSCRFYCYGEENRYSKMLTEPMWYLMLGRTAQRRQRKYRSMLDRYLVERGLKRDPTMSAGYFLGGELWVLEMKKLLSAQKRQQATGPPGKEQPPAS